MMDIEKHNQQVIERLVDIVKNRQVRLFIVLGAGVNGHLGYKWKELLMELIRPTINNITGGEVNEEDLKKIVKENDSYTLANLAKNSLGEDSYLIKLQQLIYSNYSKTMLEKTEPLLSIAKLCQNTCIEAVVTYNYDEYFEKIFRLVNEKSGCKRKVITVCANYQSARSSKDDLRIFHVHGFFPAPDSLLRYNQSDIVLSYDEYFKNMLEPFSWQTTTQLHLLSNCVALYVGASLTDVNMLRMLSFTRQNAPVTDKKINDQNFNNRHFAFQYIHKENNVINQGDMRFCKIRQTINGSFGIDTMFGDEQMIINNIERINKNLLGK